MTLHYRFTLFAVALGLLMSIAASRHVAAQTMGQPEVFTAGAVDTNRGGTGMVQMNVDRWSTPTERQTMLQALLEKGPDGLLNAMQHVKAVGRIRTPDSIGYELRYAVERRGRDGGRDVVLATDRPISFWEAVNRPRSIDYPFTLIQIHMNPDGKGEGKLAVATKITADEDSKTIEIEDFQLQPVSLVDVKAEKKHLKGE
jgi:hypothetical protein